VAYIKLSRSSMSPCSLSVLARLVRTLRSTSLLPRAELDDEQFCNSESPEARCVPLRASIQYPQNCLQSSAGRNGFSTSTTIGNVLLRKVLTYQFPLCITQTHPL
jgi:hypothetical protein